MGKKENKVEFVLFFRKYKVEYNARHVKKLRKQKQIDKNGNMLTNKVESKPRNVRKTN